MKSLENEIDPLRMKIQAQNQRLHHIPYILIDRYDNQDYYDLTLIK